MGISENQLSNIRLYPNPTTGNVSIDLGETRDNLEITLNNNLGQRVLSKHFKATDFINIEMNVAAGIYFLQLKTAQGQVEVIKLLKQ